MAHMAHCLPTDICFLCLSRDRKISCLSLNVKHLFGFLTDWYPQTYARVCWECRAILERLRRFKEQAKRAVCALERARTGLQPMSFECLSTVSGTQMLFIDLLVCDDANVTDNSSVDISKNKIYKVEVEFEDENPKIEVKTAEELEFGANTNYENDPGHISEDENDFGTKSFVTIDLTEDNTECASQHDTEETNLPLANIQIDATSSSAEEEITSKNVENSPAIKKRERIVKTKSKRKKLIDERIKRNLTTAEKLIKKQRLAEEQKYRLYQQGKAFECDHCGKKCDTRQKILSHMRSHYKKIMCEQCAFRCTDKSSLKMHMLAHLDPSHRPHECEVCYKRFTGKYKLLVHTRSHTGERPFKCDNCGMAFTCKEALTCHIKERHIDRDTLVKKRFLQPRTKSLYMNAPLVHGKDIVVSRQMKTNSCYSINYKVIKYNDNITYECNVCKEIFENLNTFFKHSYSAHKEDITCAECNKTFKWKSQLTHHVKIVHRGERPYQCNICGARSITKSAYRVHMSSHSNEKPFKCNKCLATFKYKSSLWGHMFIHKGEKPHQCDICKARFAFKGNLIGHMKVHTKDRPFECDICSKKFPWKRNLRNHLKTHFKEQQLVPLL